MKKTKAEVREKRVRNSRKMVVKGRSIFTLLQLFRRKPAKAKKASK